MTEQVKRVVHAKYNGAKVVRCGDEWTLEPITVVEPRSSTYGSRDIVVEKVEVLKEKKKVTLEEAAMKAAEGVRKCWEPGYNLLGGGYQIHWDKGSGTFDSLVRDIRPELYPDIQKADKKTWGVDGWVMRCPGCQEWMKISDSQKAGTVCTDHYRTDGGCGFHGYTFGSTAVYICDLGDVLDTQKSFVSMIRKERQLMKKEIAKGLGYRVYG